MGTKVQHRKEYAPIPALLRAMREEAGLSQRDLAKTLGVNSQTQIQYSETKSRRVDLAEFVAWARACGISPEEALKRYLAQAYPDASKLSPPKNQASYPTNPQAHLVLREGTDAQKLDLARAILDQLAQAQKPGKAPRKRREAK